VQDRSFKDRLFQRLAEGGHADSDLLPAPQGQFPIGTRAHGPVK